MLQACHEIHVFVKDCDDQRATILLRHIKNVVMLAVGEKQFRSSFQKYTRPDSSLSDPHESLFQRGLVATRMLDTPFLNGITSDG